MPSNQPPDALLDRLTRSAGRWPIPFADRRTRELGHVVRSISDLLANSGQPCHDRPGYYRPTVQIARVIQ